MAEGTGPDAVTPEGCSSRSGDRAHGTRLRSRGGGRTGHHDHCTGHHDRRPPGSAPASPGPKTQTGAFSTLAVRTTPMYLSERNADTSAQSFGTYCEHGCDNGLY